MRHTYTAAKYLAWLFICAALAMALFSVVGCTTARKATNYFNNHEDTAAGYCAVKFPVKTFTKTVIKTVAGKPDTVTVAGETVYADCSEAVISALDEAARKHVAVKCPPTKVITKTETVYVHDTTVAENTSLARAWELKYYATAGDLKTMTSERDGYKAASSKHLWWALWTWIAIVLFFIVRYIVRTILPKL